MPQSSFLKRSSLLLIYSHYSQVQVQVQDSNEFFPNIIKLVTFVNEHNHSSAMHIPIMINAAILDIHSCFTLSNMVRYRYLLYTNSIKQTYHLFSYHLFVILPQKIKLVIGLIFNNHSIAIHKVDIITAKNSESNNCNNIGLPVTRYVESHLASKRKK